MSVRLTNEYLTWERGSQAGLPFTARVRVNYPEQTVTYRPGFWQMIKWAWVQYVAVLVVFVFTFRQIKTFVFAKQILPTSVIPPPAAAVSFTHSSNGKAHFS